MNNTQKPPPIIPIASQAYNAVMHATCGRCAQHHDAQRGLITNILAGAWAVSQRSQQTAYELKSKFNSFHPHKEFHRKISRDSISRDL